MNVDDILRATESFPRRVFGDGEFILQDGVRSSSLLVLESGVIEVQRRSIAVVRMDEAGSVVGELGLLLDTPASADVVAIGPVTVRVIADAPAFFVESPDFALYLATTLARRLWQVSTYLSDLQEQLADRGDTLGLVPAVLRDLLGSTRAPADPGSDRETDHPY